VNRISRENENLALELMNQTKKLMALESKRSNLEDMLTQKESQLDFQQYSRTMRSEIQDGAIVTNHSRENTIINNGKSPIPPKQTSSKKMADKLSRMGQTFKETLIVLFHYLELEVPPVENLEDPRWSPFIKKLKVKLDDIKDIAESTKESANNYKKMLNEKCIE